MGLCCTTRTVSTINSRYLLIGHTISYEIRYQGLKLCNKEQ